MPIERVCSSCFEDQYLRAWIRADNGPRGCDACGGYDSPTMPIDEIAERIETLIARRFGRAVDHLPYETSEGGYLGPHWDKYEIIEAIGLVLPRDSGALLDALLDRFDDEPWCEFDWLSLEPDEALRSSWERFCRVVKHKRRFFFHAEGDDDQDSYTPASLLRSIAAISERFGLVTELRPGINLWRARPGLQKGHRSKATQFGPPPIEYSLQSNRMNPPGIPMLYLASTVNTALTETRVEQAKVGLWRARRPLLVLDLRTLPPVPGFFSDATRDDALSLSFLHDFAADIMKPVARDDRVHVDYLPSQVVTEYFRDRQFGDRNLDGVAYGSTVHRQGWNVALFLSDRDLGLAKSRRDDRKEPSLEFVRGSWATLPAQFRARTAL